MCVREKESHLKSRAHFEAIEIEGEKARKEKKESQLVRKRNQTRRYEMKREQNRGTE